MPRKPQPHQLLSRLYPCYDDCPFTTMCEKPGHKGSATTVHNLTGYPLYIIDRAWADCKHHFNEFHPTRKADYTKCYFLIGLMEIHLAPTARNIPACMYTLQTGHISTATFRTRVKPLIQKWFTVINYIHWENRLLSNNHSVFFPKNVTGIVDCAPIRVTKPRRSRANRKLYQPKYKSAVLKIQLVCSLTGGIIYASFSHAGAPTPTNGLPYFKMLLLLQGQFMMQASGRRPSPEADSD